MKKQPNIPEALRSFIDREKATEPNPFLTTRVMAAIESRKESMVTNWFKPMWKPFLAMASLVLVIWAGVEAGSSWVSNPDDRVNLVNDSQMENLSFYTQTETE